MEFAITHHGFLIVHSQPRSCSQTNGDDRDSEEFLRNNNADSPFNQESRFADFFLGRRP